MSRDWSGLKRALGNGDNQTIDILRAKLAKSETRIKELEEALRNCVIVMPWGRELDMATNILAKKE